MMKLYGGPAPNPRRAKIFVAEKGLDIPMESIDVFKGENLTPDYLAKSPFGLVPALELDDGTVLCEVPALCRYLESQYPEPNLMGKDPIETAHIEAWERFAEMSGMQAVGEYFRNGSEAFNERGLPGSTDLPRIEALIERGERRIAGFYTMLEKRFAESEYLGCNRFTLADITALCVVDFATFAKHGIPDGNANTKRWHAACSARPSTKA
jgi:glutathione S-transferase